MRTRQDLASLINSALDPLAIKQEVINDTQDLQHELMDFDDPDNFLECLDPDLNNTFGESEGEEDEEGGGVVVYDQEEGEDDGGSGYEEEEGSEGGGESAEEEAGAEGGPEEDPEKAGAVGGTEDMETGAAAPAAPAGVEAAAPEAAGIRRKGRRRWWSRRYRPAAEGLVRMLQVRTD